MTEAEWHACQSPKKMLRALGKKVAGRKQQLFLCGICRMLGDAMPEFLQTLVDLQERLVDGELDPADYNRQMTKATAQALDAAESEGRSDVLAMSMNLMDAVMTYDPHNGLRAAQEWGEEVAIHGIPSRERSRARAAFRAKKSDLLRDLFPPPEREYVVQPAFVGGGLLLPDGSTFHVPEAARAIAVGVQQDQAFDRLPILADALEDANFGDRPLLDHLRHGTNHRRGCWALDVVLGRG